MNVANHRQLPLVIAVAISATALLNYILWIWGWHVPLFFLALLLIVSIVLCIFDIKNEWPTLLFIGLIAIGAVGSPIVDWDARSIWFFHAKRIFIDGSLYTQLDDYAPWSHNDYPNLIPSLAASIAKGFGFWNEVLPKIAVIFCILPCILTLRSKITSTNVYASTLVLLAWMCREMLINGYADALLGIMTLSSILLISKPNENEKDQAKSIAHLTLALFCIFLTMIILTKNEGQLICLLLIFIAFATNKYSFKLSIACAIPLIFFLITWKIPLVQNAIHNDLMAPGLVSRTLARLSSHSDMYLIAKKMLSKSGIYFFLLAICLWQCKKMRGFLAPGALFIASYSAALFAIYLSTPADLAWHIATSLTRTFLVVNIVALGVLCFCLDRFILMNSRFS